MKKLSLLPVSVLLTAFLVGCGAGYQYNVKLVKYVPQSPVAKDETRVFVFRISNITGAAHRFAIINNDTVVGSLGSGDFMSFATKEDQNLVAAVIPTSHSDSARTFFYFDGRKGEEIYLRFKLKLQEDLDMKEISREEAYKLMAKYDYYELQEFPKPKWHLNLLDLHRRIQKQKAD